MKNKLLGFIRGRCNLMLFVVVLLMSFVSLAVHATSQAAVTPRIAAGANHTVTLNTNGTVWIWGLNTYGQLGDGTTTNRTTPVQVNGLTGVIAVAGGAAHTLALKSDGTVWAWGQIALVSWETRRPRIVVPCAGLQQFD